MTNQQHQFTPPPELVQHWLQKANREIGTLKYNIIEIFNYGVTQAAQWGWDQRGTNNEAQLQERADQELEACCEWLDIPNNRSDRGDGWLMPGRLRRARRPEPPSLKKQAYAALDTYIYGNPDHRDKQNAYNTIRRALEQLND